MFGGLAWFVGGDNVIRTRTLKGVTPPLAYAIGKFVGVPTNET